MVPLKPFQPRMRHENYWLLNNLGLLMFSHADCESGGVIQENLWIDRNLGIFKCWCGEELKCFGFTERATKSTLKSHD
jgi:hypothetical protein